MLKRFPKMIYKSILPALLIWSVTLMPAAVFGSTIEGTFTEDEPAEGSAVEGTFTEDAPAEGSIAVGTFTEDEPAEGSAGESEDSRLSDKNLTDEEKLQLIEEQEAEKRAEKERQLKAVVYQEMLGDFGASFENAEVYFYCIDGQDYLAASDGATSRIYLPRMTKSGEYFLAEGEAGEAAASQIYSALDETHLVSTQDFWNRIELAEKPEEKHEDPHPVDQNGVMMVPYFNQGAGYFKDGEWTCTDWPSATFYDGQTLQALGCGFTATAMALSYIGGEIVPPTDLMGLSDYNRMGANGTIGVHAASLYGFDAYQTGDFSLALQELRNGHPVMVYVGPSVFTKGTHYILLVGILPDGTIAVNDPGKTYNSYFYCGVTFDPSTVQAAAMGGPDVYTVFG